MDEVEEPHIMPECDYDPKEAKFCACLFWLVFHATEDGDFENIPPEITCPTERDLDEKFHIRPLVAKFLCSGRIYTKVCSQVFQCEEQLKSLWDVIQELSNDGFYAVDANDKAVTEERLMKESGFDLDAHLALMDAVMMAHVNRSVRIQQVVNAISTFASFNAAKELPFDLEDSFLLWMNKINSTNERRIHKSKSPETSISPRRFRFKKDQVLEKPAALFPKLDDLQTDIADGKALLSLVYFYCPDAISLENIKLSNPLKQGDAISNIELFRELCAQHICTSVFALRTEDFIYKAAELKNNVLALLSEIFVKVELDKENNIDVNRLGTMGIQNNLGISFEKPDFEKAEEGKQDEDKIDSKNGSLETMEAMCKTDRNDVDSMHYKERRKANEREVTENRNLKSIENQHEDNVEVSIQDQLDKLKSLSSLRREVVNKETKSVEPLNPGKSAGKHAVKSRQPLLSKRSKKQLANLGDEDRCLSAEDLTGMQLVDFDLKRSHSLTSVVGKANYTVDPSKSFRAWEAGKSTDDESKSKNQKISLEFKPDPKPYRRATSNASQQQPKEDPSHDINLASTSNIVEKEDCRSKQKSFEAWSGQHNLHENDVNYENLSRQQDQHKRAIEPLEESLNEDLDKFRADILERTRAAKDNEDFKEDFNEPQLEEDDYLIGGQLSISSAKQTYQLGQGVSPRPNKLLGLNQDHGVLYRDTQTDSNIQDHDDELSTIAETSEPSTPTVYSFNTGRSFDDSESSHTIGSENDSAKISFSDSQNSPTIGSNEITPLNSISDTESSLIGNKERDNLAVADSQSDLFGYRGTKLTGSSYPPERRVLNRNKPQIYTAKSDEDSQFLEVSDVVPRTSYTILNSKMSVDAAKAAGLPIINADNDFDKGTVDSFSSSILSKGGMHDVDEVILKTENKLDKTGKKDVIRNSSKEPDETNLPHHMTEVISDGEITGNEARRSRECLVTYKRDLSHAAPESLEFNRKEETRNDSSSFFGEQENTAVESPRQLRKKWNHNEEEGKEDAISVYGSDKTYIIPRTSPRKETQINGEFDFKDEEGEKDLNVTTTWSQIQREEGSLSRILKSPRNSKNHSVTAMVEGQTINWAQFAQRNEPEEFVSESEDEGGGKASRESLAPKLAVLKMQLEEKRRHIEEGKRRMMDQWNEERTRLGQQAFWLAVGKETKVERDKREQEKQAALDAEKKKKPGLIFFPFSDENDPEKVGRNPRRARKESPKKEGDSPPNECSTPVTPVAGQQRDNRISSTASDYPVHQNRVGSTTMMEASPNDLQGETFLIRKHTGQEATFENRHFDLSNDGNDAQIFDSPHGQYTGDMRQDRPFVQSDHRQSSENYRDHVSYHQDHVFDAPHDQMPGDLGQGSPASQPGQLHHTATAKPKENRTPVGYDHQRGDISIPEGEFSGRYPASEVNRDFTGNKGKSSQQQRNIDNQDVNSQYYYEITDQQNYERYVNSASKPAESSGQVSPAQRNQRTAWSDPYAIQANDFPLYQGSVAVPQTNSMQHDNNHMQKFDENYIEEGSGNTLVDPPTGFQGPGLDPPEENKTTEKGITMVIQSDDLSPKDSRMPVNLSEHIESGPTTLTPEQQKKKEKFIQNRIKRQQEEKAKREAELEKKRRKEEKLKERKAKLETKEREEQERVRKQRQEEENTRRRMEGEEDRTRMVHRLPRRDDQWNTPPNRRPPGNSRSQIPLEGADSPQAQPSSFAEYKGPPVYVKPTGKSNRQIMVNAISYCCLSGEVNKEAKEKSLQVLSQSNATHFFVLFRDGLKFRGLYTYSQEADEAHKIYGVGPKVIVNKMVERLFKYSSGAKSFSQIPAKSLSIQVDGIQIKKECWNPAKGGNLPSKTDSNLRKGATPNSKSEQLKKGSPKISRR